MTYEEVLENARRALSPGCLVCPDCDGRACRGRIPGMGAVKSGRSFTVCRDFFKSLRIPLDAVHEAWEPDATLELFGRRLPLPFFAAPIGGLSFNCKGGLTEAEYVEAAVLGALDAGGLAFTGDGPLDECFDATLPVIRQAGGMAVPTLKPWTNEKALEKLRLVEQAGALAFAMDVDSAALINLKKLGKPVTPKPPAELAELAAATPLPFIVKGVMTPRAALRCAEAGAYGIVVSSHGGRILEDTPAPAALLGEIRAAVGQRLKILVDGGVRSGGDVFKCLALGADGVLIGRPYAIAAHGGGREGVALYTRRIAEELRETMRMTDCRTLSDITMDKLRPDRPVGG